MTILWHPFHEKLLSCDRVNSRQLSWAKKPVPKDDILYKSIYLTFLENIYRNKNECASGWSWLKGKGCDRDYGLLKHTVLRVRETQCIETIGVLPEKPHFIKTFPLTETGQRVHRVSFLNNCMWLFSYHKVKIFLEMYESEYLVIYLCNDANIFCFLVM